MLTTPGRAWAFRRTVIETVLETLAEHELLDGRRWTDVDGSHKFVGMLFGLADVIDLILSGAPEELQLSPTVVEWLRTMAAKQVIRGLGGSPA